MKAVDKLKNGRWEAQMVWGLEKQEKVSIIGIVQNLIKKKEKKMRPSIALHKFV